MVGQVGWWWEGGEVKQPIAGLQRWAACELMLEIHHLTPSTGQQALCKLLVINNY